MPSLDGKNDVTKARKSASNFVDRRRGPPAFSEIVFLAYVDTPRPEAIARAATEDI